MFKITKDGATVAMTEAPNYIKQAENGCFVLCPEAEATGIAHNGTVYHLLGRPDMAGAEITVMLEETDAGAEIAKAASVSATGIAKLSVTTVSGGRNVRGRPRTCRTERRWKCRICSRPWAGCR